MSKNIIVLFLKVFKSLQAKYHSKYSKIRISLLLKFCLLKQGLAIQPRGTLNTRSLGMIVVYYRPTFKCRPWFTVMEFSVDSWKTCPQQLPQVSSTTGFFVLQTLGCHIRNCLRRTFPLLKNKAHQGNEPHTTWVSHKLGFLSHWRFQFLIKQFHFREEKRPFSCSSEMSQPMDISTDVIHLSGIMPQSHGKRR